MWRRRGRAEPRRHRLLLALGLVLLAPTVGEFLLGNIPLSHYGSVVVLAPMYGAGALLIRESVRRTGRGWPSMLLLGAAYAVVEEALVDQMVFNPGYLGLDSFAGMAELPGLHLSITLLVWSIALHAIWSTAVPIALVEALDPVPDEPWLGRVGLTVTAVVFVVGCVALAAAQAYDLDFVAGPWQLGSSTVVVLALAVAAFGLPHRPLPALPGAAPAPWLVASFGFVVTSGYWLSTDVPLTGWWWVVGSALLAAGAGLGTVSVWSRRVGWGGAHRLALATGVAATYAVWFGPAQAVELGTGRSELVAGAVVFGLAVASVAAAGWRRQGRLATRRIELSEG